MTKPYKTADRVFAHHEMPFLICGPAGCGKTTMLDLLKKFFGADNVVDDWMPAAGSCLFEQLQPRTLYLSRYRMGSVEALHGITQHGVSVLTFYQALQFMGEARGKTFTRYAEEQATRSF